MTNDPAASILAALELAVFERRPDGSFASLGALPDWFARLARDQTFPFLGTFLEEAHTHWESARPGRLRSGLCTEVDDQGREFHFEVSAIVAAAGQFLVFERPAGAEQLQAVLQRARQEALERESRTRSDARLHAITTTLEFQAQEARRVGRLLTGRGHELTVTEGESRHLTVDLETAGAHLASLLDTIVETSRLVAQTFEPE